MRTLVEPHGGRVEGGRSVQPVTPPLEGIGGQVRRQPVDGTDGAVGEGDGHAVDVRLGHRAGHGVLLAVAPPQHRNRERSAGGGLWCVLVQA